jgi:hypothetical protein
MAGLSSLFSEQMADRVLPTEESMARGGIVAFAGDEEDNDPRSGQLVSTNYTPGSPADYAYFLGKGRTLFDEMGKSPTYTAMTPAEQIKYRADYIKQLQEGAGESPYKKRLEGITTERDALGKDLERAKGLSALRAAGAMLQGQGLVQGLGRAGGAFADSYEKAEAANRVENRALRDMEFNLIDAQRKERMGLNKEATTALREVDRDKALAVKARNDRLAAQGNLARGMAAAAKPQRAAARSGAKGPKEFESNIDAYLEDIKERFPDLTPARQRAMAVQLYQERKAPGLPGALAKVEGTAEENARERAAKRAYVDVELNAALRKKDTAAAETRRKAILAEELAKPDEAAAPRPAPGASAPRSVSRTSTPPPPAGFVSQR